MKLKLIVLTIAAITFTAGCQNAPKSKKAKTIAAEAAKQIKKEAVMYHVVPSETFVIWKGSKPTGFHGGTLHAKSGTLAMDGSKLHGGKFILDMLSIKTDIPKEDKAHGHLKSHLESEDFFHAEKHPNSVFEITGVSKKNGKTIIEGNLTIKDSTKNITFPAMVNHTDTVVTIESDTFAINRAHWNIRYGSKTFFNDLKNKFINDHVELKVHLKAKKK